MPGSKGSGGSTGSGRSGRSGGPASSRFAQLLSTGLTLFSAAQNAEKLSKTAQDLVHNRVKLLALELDQEKRHIQSSLVLSVVGALVVVVGLVFGAAAGVLAVPEQHRVLTMCVAAGFFVLLGLVCLVMARKHLRARPRPFESLLKGFGQESGKD